MQSNKSTSRIDSRGKVNSMLNITDDQKRQWQMRNAGSVLISRNGAKSKFTTPDYNEIAKNLVNQKNQTYFKLVEIAKEVAVPYIKYPRDK